MKNRTRLNNRKMLIIVILLCVIVGTTIASSILGGETAQPEATAAPDTAEITDTAKTEDAADTADSAAAEAADAADTEAPADTVGYEVRPDGSVVVRDGTERGFKPQSVWVLVVMMICVAVTAVVLLVPIKRDKKDR